jgi:LemA protein
MVVAGTLAVVVAGWVVWAFNRLVRLRQLMREAWSGVQVQLERR